MATVTVTNTPDDLYEQLKAVAEANRRSVNSEVIVCIERRFVSSRPEPAEILE